MTTLVSAGDIISGKPLVAAKRLASRKFYNNNIRPSKPHIRLHVVVYKLSHTARHYAGVRRQNVSFFIFFLVHASYECLFFLLKYRL